MLQLTWTANYAHSIAEAAMIPQANAINVNLDSRFTLPGQPLAAFLILRWVFAKFLIAVLAIPNQTLPASSVIQASHWTLIMPVHVPLPLHLKANILRKIGSKLL